MRHFLLLGLIVMSACGTKGSSTPPPLTVHKGKRMIAGVAEHSVAFGVRNGFELADRNTLQATGSGTGNLIHLREPASASLVSDQSFPPTFEDLRSGRIKSIPVRTAGSDFMATVSVPEPHERVTGLHAECSAYLCAFVWQRSADDPPIVETLDLATGATIARYERPPSSAPGIAHATRDVACYVYTTVGDTYVDHVVCEDLRTGRHLWQVDGDGVASLSIVVTATYVAILEGSKVTAGFVATDATLVDPQSGQSIAGDAALGAALRDLHGTQFDAIPFSDRVLVSVPSVSGAGTESVQVGLDRLVEVALPTGAVVGAYQHPGPKTSRPIVIPIRPGHVALYGR